MENITITKTPIELYKLLKFANLVESGGQAKAFIQDEYVQVNGQIETQKGKKINAGDTITFMDKQYTVTLPPQP